MYFFFFLFCFDLSLSLRSAVFCFEHIVLFYFSAALATKGEPG